MKVGTDGVLLGAWVDLQDAREILDIGTGSGVIAIMLAQRTAQARIVGVDVDPDSAAQASENMAECPWKERLTCVESSIQDYSRAANNRFDLLVTNPPFFSGGTFSGNAARDSVRHTVKLPHGDLLGAARELLAPQGRLALILPHLEGLRFIELAEAYQFYCRRRCEVHTRSGKPVERLLMEFKKEAGSVAEEKLVLQEQEGKENWTAAYRELCKDFYPHF